MSSLLRFLLHAGAPFAPFYLAFSKRYVANELDKFTRRGIGRTDSYDLMSMYPDLQRILFIHIPKCGGTSVRRSLIEAHLCAPIPWRDRGIDQCIDFMTRTAVRKSFQRQLLDNCAAERAPEELQHRYLRVLAGYFVAFRPKRVFALGHPQARELLPLHRQDRDLLFTTVREPRNILRSLVAYRVTHTLKHPHRSDSIELLESLQLDIGEFRDLVSKQPKIVTERILKVQSPSLGQFLAFDDKTDVESVWQGLKEQTVYVGHLSEQGPMLASLLGGQQAGYRLNTSSKRQGLPAQFAAAIEHAWLEPFVDSDSRQLYQRLESSGIIGFWRKGGTVQQYRNLLRSAS